MTVISTLLPDVYSIIQNDIEMIELLLRLRLQLSAINSVISIFHSLSPDKMEFHLTTHNEYLRKHIGEDLLPLINTIMHKLESKYQLKNPFSDPRFEIFKKI